jgi:hypothetical protein
VAAAAVVDASDAAHTHVGVDEEVRMLSQGHTSDMGAVPPIASDVMGADQIATTGIDLEPSLTGGSVLVESLKHTDVQAKPAYSAQALAQPRDYIDNASLSKPLALAQKRNATQFASQSLSPQRHSASSAGMRHSPAPRASTAHLRDTTPENGAGKMR